MKPNFKKKPKKRIDYNFKEKLIIAYELLGAAVLAKKHAKKFYNELEDCAKLRPIQLCAIIKTRGYLK
jgi:hypothetical protein